MTSPLRIAFDYKTFSGTEYDSRMILEDILKLSRLPYEYLNITEVLRLNNLVVLKKNFYDTCVELIAADYIDLCPLRLSITPQRLQKMDYLSPHIYENNLGAFILRNSDEDVEEVDYRSIFKVFDSRLWVALMVVVLLLPVVCSLMKKEAAGSVQQRYSEYFEQIFGCLVLQGRNTWNRGMKTVVGAKFPHIFASRKQLYQDFNRVLGFHRANNCSMLQRINCVHNIAKIWIHRAILRPPEHVLRWLQIRHPFRHLHGLAKKRWRNPSR